MKTCKTCLHRDAQHTCLNDKISEDYNFSAEKVQDMLIYEYRKGGRFYAGDNFGCIHHADKTGKES